MSYILILTLIFEFTYSFRRTILVGHVVGIVRIIWAKAYLSEHYSSLALMTED
jgi:thiamine transporter ThiT